MCVVQVVVSVDVVVAQKSVRQSGESRAAFIDDPLEGTFRCSRFKELSDMACPNGCVM